MTFVTKNFSVSTATLPKIRGNLTRLRQRNQFHREHDSEPKECFPTILFLTSPFDSRRVQPTRFVNNGYCGFDLIAMLASRATRTPERELAALQQLFRRLTSGMFAEALGNGEFIGHMNFSRHGMIEWIQDSSETGLRR